MRPWLTSLLAVSLLTLTAGPALAAAPAQTGAETAVNSGNLAAKAKTKPLRLEEPRGPYAVGKTSKHFTDPNRGEWYTEDPNDRREVIVDIWYPAETPQQPTATAPYHPHIDHLTAEIGPILGIPQSDMDSYHRILTHAYEQAKVASGKTAYPVLLFSHGNFGHSAQNTYQAEEFASQGYIVVGLNHPYMGTGIVLKNGPVTYRGTLGWPEESELVKIYDTMAADASFVLDELVKINRTDSARLLTGRLDLTRVGMFGHSDGGAATAYTLARDARFKAGVNLDGYPVGPAAIQGVKPPLLYMASSRQTYKPVDEVTDEELSQLQMDRKTYATLAELERLREPNAFRLMKGGGYFVRLNGTSHYDFSDIVLWDKAASLRGTLKPRYAHRMINKAVLQFFDKTLNGERAPLLDGKKDPYEEMEITKVPVS